MTSPEPEEPVLSQAEHLLSTFQKRLTTSNQFKSQPVQAKPKQRSKHVPVEPQPSSPKQKQQPKLVRQSSLLRRLYPSKDSNHPNLSSKDSYSILNSLPGANTENQSKNLTQQISRHIATLKEDAAAQASFLQYVEEFSNERNRAKLEARKKCQRNFIKENKSRAFELTFDNVYADILHRTNQLQDKVAQVQLKKEIREHERYLAKINGVEYPQ
ncbi:hypothetical protein P9112_003307 [Eukaryota sp. TZLM1-RC]